MTNPHDLLDAFAHARSTWDDIVGMQPDVVSGSQGELNLEELVELERRVAAHRDSMDELADAIDTSPNGSNGQER